tara:strand:+ start:1394 stop:1630 length:237 start_codon:yes stop_codon:yes gene_type:complete
MTPKEKAKELVDRFIPFSMDNHIEKYAIHSGKQCALIAVEEIINSSPSLPMYDGGSFVCDIEESTIYWQEVKQEIEKL